ncbi:MAG: hypothetical protein R2882_06000 [Gemmatimonadales bacterium]
MLAFAKTLGSPEATVFPKAAAFWQKTTSTSRLCSCGVREGRGDQRLQSGERDVWKALPTCAIPPSSWPQDAAGISFSSEVPNCSNREAAAMILVTHNYPPPKASMKPKIPVSTKADLDHNVAILNATVKFVRHQWPVVGGDDKNKRRDRQEEFVGYLQQCLELSRL